MGRKKYRRLVMSVFGIIVFSFSTPGFGQEKENISTKDIKEMVDLLENPQKREAFVKDLKNLKQLKEATPKGGQEKEAKQPEKERKILLIENLFVKFESLAGKVMEAATSSASLVAKTPEAFRETKSFLSQSENLLKLMIT
jgi:uncharacterized membrane protein YdbT with pleckstrin-like domain